MVIWAPPGTCWRRPRRGAVSTKAVERTGAGSTPGGRIGPDGAEPLPGPKTSAPAPDRLPDGDVDPVVDVGQRDHQQQGGQSLVVVVPGRLVPDLVRHGVGPVREPGHG